MSLPRIRPAVLALGLAAAGPFSSAQEALDVGRYVEIVKRSHPAAAERAGLEQAAEAERRAARVLPDPVFDFSWDRAHPTDLPGANGDETGYALSQTLPWPGTWRAGAVAGDRAADVLRAGAEGVSWEIEARARLAFARLEVARGRLEVARGAEEDARSLRDLVARRAELGESRESDRIKASVEWLRQQRQLTAAKREAQVAEAILRALAMEPLPQPLVLKATAHPPLPPLDPAALAARLAETNPRLRAARAEAARRAGALFRGPPRPHPRPRRQRLPPAARSTRRRTASRSGSSCRSGTPTGARSRARRPNRARRPPRRQRGRGSTCSRSWRSASRLSSSRRTRPLLLEREILPQATRSLELARLLYEEGETSLLDLLDAQRTYRESQRERLDSHLAQAFAVADVQRLAGPDFDPWR